MKSFVIGLMVTILLFSAGCGMLKPDNVGAPDETSSPIGAVAPQTAPPESTAPPVPSLPAEPFAVKVKTGEAIHLGMSRDEAEAVAGAPVEEGTFNQSVCDGVVLAYRDNTLVYILIDDEQWNANGIVELGMPTEDAVEKLRMAFEEGNKAYALAYFTGGEKEQLYLGQEPERGKDYRTVLTLFTNGTVKGIIMADRQYALTMQ